MRSTGAAFGLALFLGGNTGRVASVRGANEFATTISSPSLNSSALCCSSCSISSPPFEVLASKVTVLPFWFFAEKALPILLACADGKVGTCRTFHAELFVKSRSIAKIENAKFKFVQFVIGTPALDLTMATINQMNPSTTTWATNYYVAI